MLTYPIFISGGKNSDSDDEQPQPKKSRNDHQNPGMAGLPPGLMHANVMPPQYGHPMMGPMPVGPPFMGSGFVALPVFTK